MTNVAMGGPLAWAYQRGREERVRRLEVAVPDPDDTEPMPSLPEDESAPGPSQSAPRGRA